MEDYYAVFSLTNLERFKDIFGERIIRDVRETVDKKIRQLGYFLFSNHQFAEAEIINIDFSLWALPFSLNKSNKLLDPREQLTTLQERGQVFLRNMLINEFGVARGNKIDFNFTLERVNDDSQKIKEKVLNIAEAAEEKESGKDYTRIAERKEIAGIISEAKIQTYLQPLIDLSEESTVGYEVLTRGPSGDLFSAPDLFGAAERYQLREKLELLCLQEGLKWVRELPEDMFLSLNITPQLMFREEFSGILLAEKYSAYHSRLVLEFTENIPLSPTKQLKEKVFFLQEKGIQFALDDTGCGFFVLEAVEKIRPHIVKLCITVTNHLLDGKEIQQEVLKTVQKIKQLHPHCLVLAEGVENKQQLRILKEDCALDMAQGFYFSRPRPAGEVLGLKKNS